jgi:cellulose biosynthesis protein BcsQ
MPIVTVVATKGGAGKTTTTVGLADALIELGHSVRIIDTDPQASAYHWRPELTTRLPRPDAQQLDAAISEPAYYLIDTPPGASEAAVVAIEAAELVLAVTRLSPIDLVGLNHQRRMIEPDLILPTQVDRRRRAHVEALELLQSHFAERVLDPIPASTVVERAQGHGSPIPSASTVGLAYHQAAERITQETKP